MGVIGEHEVSQFRNELCLFDAKPVASMRFRV
jgi:hypothetical protein